MKRAAGGWLGATAVSAVPCVSPPPAARLTQPWHTVKNPDRPKIRLAADGRMRYTVAPCRCRPCRLFFSSHITYFATLRLRTFARGFIVGRKRVGVQRAVKDLRASTAEGTATSVMVGIGETYLPAFVLAISANQLACGLVSTVPLLAGAVLQMVSPRMVRGLGSYRRWVVCCAAIQAAAFVPLLLGAVGLHPRGGRVRPGDRLLGGRHGLGAAWNAWVETLVPQRLQARYFARRAWSANGA